MLLIELIKLFLESVSNKHSRASYANNLREFYIWNKNKKINDVQQKDIDNFINRLDDKGLKHSTINSYLYTLSKFFKFCKEYHIEKDFNFPFSKFKKSTPQFKIVQESDFNEIIDNIYNHLNSIDYENIENLCDRNILITQLLIEIGVSVSELCNLKVKDIDMENSLVRIFEPGRPDRKIKISPGTKYILEIYMEGLNKDRYLFYRQDRGAHLTNQKLSPRSVQRIISYYSNNKFKTKDFRWTFIIYKLVIEYGIYEVSDMVGGLSDDTKTFLRNKLDEFDKILKVTEFDYNAYEYLRHKYGKSKLFHAISKGRLKTDYSEELEKKGLLK